MRLLRHTLILAATGMIWTGMAQAHGFGELPLNTGLNYPGAPRAMPEAPSPYAMNYTDEAAQSLGVKDGRMDLFSTRPASSYSYAPTFSGGIDHDGAMLKLKWLTGQ